MKVRKTAADIDHATNVFVPHGKLEAEFAISRTTAVNAERDRLQLRLEQYALRLGSRNGEAALAIRCAIESVFGEESTP